MFQISEELIPFTHLFPDYPMHLLETTKIENLEAYHGELKALLGYIRYQSDKRDLENFRKNNFRDKMIRYILQIGDREEL